MAVTDPQIRKAKPRDRTWRLFVGQGLYIEIAPSAGKWWRFEYRYNGYEKRLSLGTYPAVSLREARERCEKGCKLLASSIDPGEQRQAEKLAGTERASNTFEVVAREWFARQKTIWVEGHASKILLRMESDLFPWLRTGPSSSGTTGCGASPRCSGHGLPASITAPGAASRCPHDSASTRSGIQKVRVACLVPV